MDFRLSLLIFVALTSTLFNISTYGNEVVKSSGVNESVSTTPVSSDPESSQVDTFGEQTEPNDGDQAIPETTMETNIHDPLESVNRVTFTFNDKIDIYFLKPIATLYNKIIPKPLNLGIHNAFNNIDTLTTIANDLLQLHFGQAANDIWRITINTTIGIGGLFDIGERIGLAPYTNDFGLTMARWGWRRSTYIVLPFFGPNTIRDTIRIPVDYYYLCIYPYIYPYKTRYGLYGLSVVDSRAQLLKFQSVLDEVAIDQYVFMRSAYVQRRTFQIDENLALGFSRRNNAFSESATTICTGNESIDSAPIDSAPICSVGSDSIATDHDSSASITSISVKRLITPEIHQSFAQQVKQLIAPKMNKALMQKVKQYIALEEKGDRDRANRLMRR